MVEHWSSNTEDAGSIPSRKALELHFTVKIHAITFLFTMEKSITTLGLREWLSPAIHSATNGHAFVVGEGELHSKVCCYIGGSFTKNGLKSCSSML